MKKAIVNCAIGRFIKACSSRILGSGGEKEEEGERGRPKCYEDLDTWRKAHEEVLRASKDSP